MFKLENDHVYSRQQWVQFAFFTDICTLMKGWFEGGTFDEQNMVES